MKSLSLIAIEVQRGLRMRLRDVSHITQRMVFLRLYEILLEANQALDMSVPGKSQDAGYPFCYFAGSQVQDLLAQNIFWQGEFCSLRDALAARLPDINSWLSPDILEVSMDDFLGWKPHTLAVQELVDDVKQRVLEVIDAVHAAEKLKSMDSVSSLIRMLVPGFKNQILTGSYRHSLLYRYHDGRYEPVVYEYQGAAKDIKWFHHAFIHGLWLVGACGGRIEFESAKETQISGVFHSL